MASECYGNAGGDTFYSFKNCKEFLYLLENKQVFFLYQDGNKERVAGKVEEAFAVFSSYAKNGTIKKPKEEILKQFNISKVADGYYADSKRKGFGVWQTIGNKKKRSIYLMSRNNGDWETVMISGPDFSNDFKKDSPEAINFDTKVENGEWIKVEVIEK